MLLGCQLGYVKKHMDEIVEFLELGDYIYRPVRTHSSGLYSKLSFVVIAILDTDIMLVDEVLSVGDEHFHKKSYVKMEELMSSDQTFLTVSHATDTLKKFDNSALWINDGNFIQMGATDEVLAAYNEFMK